MFLHFLRRLIDRRNYPPPPRSLERRDPELPRAWISMVGSSNDPLPMLLCYARLLRNPRSLFRVFLAISRSERARLDVTLHRAGGRQP